MTQHRWLAHEEDVLADTNKHTCGAGGEWPHEPHCGEQYLTATDSPEHAAHIVAAHNTLLDRLRLLEQLAGDVVLSYYHPEVAGDGANAMTRLEFYLSEQARP